MAPASRVFAGEPTPT